MKLNPQIILMGQESRQICKELDLDYSDCETSKYGTPRLDSMIKIADKMAKYNDILLISSDVVLFKDTLKALKNIKMDEFCAVCQKSRQNVIIELDFNDECWEDIVKYNIKLQSITSGDFYLYSKGFWGKIPPFYVGRCACDSWLFYTASQKGKMIDLTKAMTIVDYIHDYKFCDAKYREEEVAYNRKLAGNNKLHINSANWVMEKDFSIRKV